MLTKNTMFGVTVGGWTLRARLGLKEWGEVFPSQPKCLLQEVVCRRGGIPAPLKSGSRYLVTPVGLPWLPSTHIPQPSFTPVPHRNLTKSALHADTHINTETNKPDRSPLQTFISSYHVFKFALPFLTDILPIKNEMQLNSLAFDWGLCYRCSANLVVKCQKCCNPHWGVCHLTPNCDWSSGNVVG